MTRSLGASVACDALAVYVRRGQSLSVLCLEGEEFRPFLTSEITLGKGLSGWVAENGKPVQFGQVLFRVR